MEGTWHRGHGQARGTVPVKVPAPSITRNCCTGPRTKPWNKGASPHQTDQLILNPPFKNPVWCIFLLYTCFQNKVGLDEIVVKH